MKRSRVPVAADRSKIPLPPTPLQQQQPPPPQAPRQPPQQQQQRCESCRLSLLELHRQALQLSLSASNKRDLLLEDQQQRSTTRLVNQLRVDPAQHRHLDRQGQKCQKCGTNCHQLKLEAVSELSSTSISNGSSSSSSGSSNRGHGSYRSDSSSVSSHSSCISSPLSPLSRGSSKHVTFAGCHGN
uniref:Kinesin-like protein KIF26A/B helical domain-containing protein n=2 Tax=Macrostomum lignano TaxID=282301 RepID=A0A1I8I4W9_9PLAT